MTGVINVYKEAGWTSGDVVNKLRGVLKTRHVGHAGTLDPAATGVLPVCVGSATRLFDYLTANKKTYFARIHFGAVTDTQDGTGTVLETGTPSFTTEELDKTLEEFRGKIMQTPPLYSALHRDGKRLYELAREGQSVELEPREVEILSLERVGEPENDECGLLVCCGKGTYIRTLCHDIGQALGCGAYMASLERRAAAGLRMEEAKTVARIEEMVRQGDYSFLLAPRDAVDFLPAIEFEPGALQRLQNGNPTMASRVISGGAEEGQPVCILCDGHFLGIGEKRGEDYRIRCRLPEE